MCQKWSHHNNLFMRLYIRVYVITFELVHIVLVCTVEFPEYVGSPRGGAWEPWESQYHIIDLRHPNTLRKRKLFRCQNEKHLPKWLPELTEPPVQNLLPLKRYRLKIL